MNFGENQFYVELHSHLDGAIRYQSLIDIAKTRGIKINQKTADEMKNEIVPTSPYTEQKFFHGFGIILSIICDNKEAISRVTQEFVQDCATKGKLCYCEVRFNPHLLADKLLTPSEVVETIADAAKRAGKQYKVEVRLILCIMRHIPELAMEVLDLAIKYKSHGVVAIDVAGPEPDSAKFPADSRIVKAFQQAREYGIHRTAHAGEQGSSHNVQEAVTDFYAERIGHGYHVVDDKAVYKKCWEIGIHFEVCPTSSFVTNALSSDHLTNHPLHKFIADEISFSINTDDAAFTNRWLVEEYEFCKEKMNISENHIWLGNMNAAKAAFLEPEEREQLIQHVRSGVPQLKTIH